MNFGRALMEGIIPTLMLVGLTVMSIKQRGKQERTYPLSTISKECQRLAFSDTGMFGLWLVLWAPRITELPVEVWHFRLEHYYAMILGIFFGIDYWQRYRAAKKRELEAIREQ
jgi:hypothetical protein